MTSKRLGRDGPRTRAVSDVIAFTLVFSIIIGSVGIVSAVGFSTLSDIKVNEQTVNAQRAMESLAENIGDLQRGHAPARAGEIEVGGGGQSPSPTGLEVSGSAASVDGSALYIGDDAAIDVEVTNSTGGTVFDQSNRVGSLRYFVGQKNRSIGIESGGVFSRFRTSVVMNQRPKITCQNSGPNTYAMVSIVELRAEGATAVSGGNVQVEAREVGSELSFADTDSGVEDVTLTFRQSNFLEGWIDGLAKANWATSGNTATCSGVERVYVRKTIIEISLA